MPSTDPATRKRYNQTYYRRHKSKAGRPPLGDEKRMLVSLRMPASVIARIQRIVVEGVATRRFPWKTQSECLNALIMRGLESMAGDDFIDEMIPYLQAVQANDGIRNHRVEAQAALNRVKVEVSELLNIKATEAAVAHFHSTMENLDHISPNVWRDWLLKELRKAYPDLLKQKPSNIMMRSMRAKPAKKAKAWIRS